MNKISSEIGIKLFIKHIRFIQKRYGYQFPYFSIILMLIFVNVGEHFEKYERMKTLANKM